MSKITLNATTFDLISTLSLDDIKLLEKQNPDALAIKDKDGDVQFVVKTGGTMGSISQYGIVFANKTRDGKAVLTYTLDTNKPADEQLNEIFDKVGAAKAKLDEIVERSLRDAAIWDEVKDRLKKNALGLSGGQQQRLCIARALAVEPKVLLMDEPTSALDPISTLKIEELAASLKKNYTIVIVTHNMQQAVRISDYTAFFLLGELVEFGGTEQIFSQPLDKRTEDYITGRFG